MVDHLEVRRLGLDDPPVDEGQRRLVGPGDDDVGRAAVVQLAQGHLERRRVVAPGEPVGDGLLVADLQQVDTAALEHGLQELAADVGHHDHARLPQVVGQAAVRVGRDDRRLVRTRQHAHARLEGGAQRHAVELVELVAVEHRGLRLEQHDALAVAPVVDVGAVGVVHVDGADLGRAAHGRQRPGHLARLTPERPAQDRPAAQHADHAGHPGALPTGVQVQLDVVVGVGLEGHRQEGRR